MIAAVFFGSYMNEGCTFSISISNTGFFIEVAINFAFDSVYHLTSFEIIPGGSSNTRASLGVISQVRNLGDLLNTYNFYLVLSQKNL